MRKSIGKIKSLILKQIKKEKDIFKGMLLYEGDYIRHSDFLEKLFREYHDFRPRYEIFLKELEASI